MRKIINLVAGLILLSSSFVSAAEKPNVLFILIDDLGYHQFGSYGSDYYETPNIDKFSEESMMFTNAYAAAALCSPTRASIMSGMYPTRLNLTDWLNGYAPPANATLAIPSWKKNMDEADIRLPQLMQSNGYRTSLIGKWHCSSHLTGWDEVLRFDGPMRSDQCNGIDCHRVKQYTDSTLNFIRRNKNTPFFCYLSHNSIHTPELESSALINKYAAKPGSEVGTMLNPIQGAMLETLDTYTGILLDSLDAMGLSENTIVVLFSDNGQHAPKQEVGVSPLRGYKCSFWEGGFREPLLVRWKGKIVAGSMCDKQVISMDFLPTLAELCGITVPYLDDLDGVSFANNLITDPDLDIVRPYLCWHYPHYHPDAEFLGAIRKGDWKLIENFNQSLYYKTGAFELYNLKTDPKESTNLIESNPAKAVELYTDLQNWRTETTAQMPGTKNPVYGVAHFQMHLANTPVKVDNFEIQTGLAQGFQYDGSGTYLSLKTGSELVYYLKVEQEGDYNLKFLYKNSATSILVKSTSFSDQTIQLSSADDWQSAESTSIYFGAGIHKFTVKVTGSALNLDKFCLTNENTTLVHDGEKPITGKLINITFEPGEATDFYSIEGNALNQNPTPVVVDNPDKTALNTTNKCLYTRTKKDLTLSPKVPAWSYNSIVFTFNEPLVLTDENRYFHLLHRKGQLLHNWLIYASDDGVNFSEITRAPCPAANTWFDMVADIKSKFESVVKIKIYLDGNWSGSDNDRYYDPTDFYYDELAFTNSAVQRLTITSDLRHPEKRNKLTLFPNPITNRLNLISESRMSKTEIYNYSGVKLSEKNLNDFEANIDVSALPAGVYLLRVTDWQNNLSTEKIVKL